MKVLLQLSVSQCETHQELQRIQLEGAVSERKISLNSEILSGPGKLVVRTCRKTGKWLVV